jgi:RNA polymerase sigma-70 factor (family 1)
MQSKKRSETVVSFQGGKRNGFAFLFKEYYPALCFFANNILHNEDEAKDIVQDSFVKLWNEGNFDDHSESIKSFLYTIIRNKCLNVLKKRKVIIKAQHELQKDSSLYDPEQLDEITYAEIMRQVFELMDELPNQMQRVFKLYYMKGKNYQEIASTLHTSSETVRKQKSTALKIIKQKLLRKQFPYVALLLYILEQHKGNS